MKSKVSVIGAASVSEQTVKKIVDMKEVQNINKMEPFSTIGSDMMLMGYAPGSNKVGLVPATSVSSVKQWAGRKWLKSGSTPKAEGVIGEKDFLAALPELIGLGCYLVKNDHSRVKLNPKNHYLTADGQEAKLDGSMGHYQWGWSVPFYYATWEDDQYLYEAFSLAEIPGRVNFRIPVASCSASGNATMDRTNGNLVSYCNKAAQYRGGNNDASKDGTYRSQLGVCASALSTAAFETAARKNGERWCNTFHAMIYVRAALFRVIMGTRDVQAAYNGVRDADGLRQGGLGIGATNPSDWSSNWGYYPYIPMDAGAELGDFTGTFSKVITGSDGNDLEITGIPSFYGLKNFYKYIAQMAGSMFGYDNASGTMDFYVGTRLDAIPFTRTKEAMTLAGTGTGVNGWSYPKNIGHDFLCPVPQDQGATSSTYYCDGFYKGGDSAGSRLCIFGGHASHGASAGLLYLHATNGLSYANAHFGALLCESAEDWDCEGYEVA